MIFGHFGRGFVLGLLLLLGRCLVGGLLVCFGLFGLLLRGLLGLNLVLFGLFGLCGERLVAALLLSSLFRAVAAGLGSRVSLCGVVVGGGWELNTISRSAWSGT